MKTKIIILTGKARSGKDTSCFAIKDYLQQYYPDLNVKKYAFADSIKQISVDLFNLDPKDCWTDKKDNMKKTHLQWHGRKLSVREFLQVFGTDICRKLWHDCWVFKTHNNIIADNMDIALISDARFPSEINYFLPFDPLVIRLLRNPLKSQHSSETSLDDYNWNQIRNSYVINNSILSLKEKNNLILDIAEKYI